MMRTKRPCDARLTGGAALRGKLVVVECLSPLRTFARRTNPLREDGASLVEMALASSVVLSLLLGMIQVSLALYAYHFTADAAREGSRWAIVRGSQCTANTPGLDHCNATSADIQNYVQALGYPYSRSMIVSATWFRASSPPATTWTACSGCNSPGNAVQVTVSYNVPLYVPFWRNANVRVGSISQMVISQ
jgi:Flp pilus assembly protein TadG